MAELEGQACPSRWSPDDSTTSTDMEPKGLVCTLLDMDLSLSQYFRGVPLFLHFGIRIFILSHCIPEYASYLFLNFIGAYN